MVKSILRTIQILEALGRQETLTISDLARSLELPKSTVHEILMTLEHEGLIQKDRERNSFHLGLRLFELGQLAQQNLEIRRVAIPFIRELNQSLDETVHLVVLDNDEVLYIECFESTKRLRTYSVIGVRAPLHCTAVGKAILAYLPDQEVERIVAQKGFERFTEHTIIDRKMLEKDRETVRSRGWSMDDVEHEPGVRCVGAPIWNHQGSVFASISVSGPTQRMTLDESNRIGPMLALKTLEISRRLGYRGAGRTPASVGT